MKGFVFDIQRFSVHDGPGIRTTVFLKGCPLRCKWCQNPEGLGRTIHLWIFDNLCTRCGACMGVCPRRALSTGQEGALCVDHSRCTRCGKCVERCAYNAMAFDGFEIDSLALARRLLADRVFFASSGGGVTFSGGEPLQQAEFMYDTAERLKALGIPTAIETSLEGRWEDIERLIQVIDFFQADIKIFDDDRHRLETGVSNRRILENFRKLTKALAGTDRVKVRIPLIPGMTLDKGNLSSIARFVSSLDARVAIELMDFNPLASAKYRRMRKKYELSERVDGLTESEKEAAHKAIGNHGTAS